MQKGLRKNTAYLINGQAEPDSGPTSLLMAAITLGVVALIAISGLIA